MARLPSIVRRSTDAAGRREAHFRGRGRGSGGAGDPARTRHRPPSGGRPRLGAARGDLPHPVDSRGRPWAAAPGHPAPSPPTYRQVTTAGSGSCTSSAGAPSRRARPRHRPAWGAKSLPDRSPPPGVSGDAAPPGPGRPRWVAPSHSAPADRWLTPPAGASAVSALQGRASRHHHHHRAGGAGPPGPPDRSPPFGPARSLRPSAGNPGHAGPCLPWPPFQLPVASQLATCAFPNSPCLLRFALHSSQPFARQPPFSTARAAPPSVRHGPIASLCRRGTIGP